MAGESDIPFENTDPTSEDGSETEILKCIYCGSIVRYIEPYDRYWCDYCSKYMEIGFGKELEKAVLEDITTEPSDEPLESEETEETFGEKTLKCPNCNYDLQYFEEYDKYWCDMCAEYMPDNFAKPEKTFSEEKPVTEPSVVEDISSAGFVEPEEKAEEASDSEKKCPNCNSPLRFIEEYGKFWCDTCLEYTSSETSALKSEGKESISLSALPEGTPVSCPVCGSQIRLIEEYGRYWCDKCLEYISSEAFEKSPTVKEEQTDEMAKIAGLPEEETAVSEPQITEPEIQDPQITEPEKTESEITEPEASDGITEPQMEDVQQVVEPEEVYPAPEEVSEFALAESYDEKAEEVAKSALQDQILPSNLCPKCGAEVRYIVQYDRFWCDDCGEYMPVGFKSGDKSEDTYEAVSVAEDETQFQSAESAETSYDENQITIEKSQGIEGEDMASPIVIEEIPLEVNIEEESTESLDKTLEPDLDLDEEKEKVDTLDLSEQISVVSAGETESVALLCPKCGKKARYIEQYDRYWCDSCGQYMPVGFGKKEEKISEPSMSMAELEVETPQDQAKEEPLDVQEPSKELALHQNRISCPNCDGKVRFIEQYQRYWCDNCEKYMPLDFGLEKVVVVPPSSEVLEKIEEKKDGSMKCPKCGSEPRYVEKYKKYWCDNCSEYLQPIYDREPPLDKSSKFVCSECGKTLVQCEPCKHMWCSQCDKCYPVSMFS